MVSNGLSNEEIGRYSRQIVLPEFGVKGQLGLKNGSVLIVGVGGLGCPAATFLASSGVGQIGLVDYDKVELSNLHRQVIHSEKTIGLSKSQSAKLFINNLNSNVKVDCYEEGLTTSNSIKIIAPYDVILDCTDNAATRYLLNDSCVILGKPLVSASALRFEGQLVTYNYKGGPCYRCLFPVPTPPEFVTNCSDGGVLGAIPGTMGTLQALEAIKFLSGIDTSFHEKMLLFDGLRGTFREVKLRKKIPTCAVCGEDPTIKTLLNDYPEFCGSGFDDKERGIVLLKENERISVTELKELMDSSSPILIDVREEVELSICSLPKTGINIPFSQIEKEDRIEELRKFLQKTSLDKKESIDVFTICRRGNDSQRAVKIFKDTFSDLPISFKDISGGLHRWAKDIDPNFPVY